MTDPGLYLHYDAIAEFHGVWTVYGAFPGADGSEPAGAFVTLRDSDRPYVYLTHAPTEPVPYFIAMHELGHVVLHTRLDGRLRVRPRLGRLDAEAEAWMWALNMALIEPDAEVWEHIANVTATYLAWPLNDRRVKPSEALAELHRHALERAASSQAPHIGYPVSAPQAG